VLSLCKLSGVELCTLFRVFFEDGRLAGLTEEVRKRALDRFHLLQPHLENDLLLKALAAAAGISFPTAQRWVSPYRKVGLPGPRNPADPNFGHGWGRKRVNGKNRGGVGKKGR
jgi:hypothetical protein